MSDLGHQIERLPGQVYRKGNLIVAPKPSDEMLAWAYMRLKREELLDRVFHEGCPSLTWCLEWFTQPNTAVLGCFKQVDGRAEMRGLGWLNSFTVLHGKSDWRKAELGEAFFRGVGMHETEQFGRLMLTWAFDELKMDVLFGSTPEPNRAAVLFARRMGFKMIGVADGYGLWNGEPCGCWISVLTRQRFEELNGEEARDGRSKA